MNTPYERIFNDLPFAIVIDHNTYLDLQKLRRQIIQHCCEYDKQNDSFVLYDFLYLHDQILDVLGILNLVNEVDDPIIYEDEEYRIASYIDFLDRAYERIFNDLPFAIIIDRNKIFELLEIREQGIYHWCEYDKQEGSFVLYDFLNSYDQALDVLGILNLVSDDEEEHQ